MFCVLCLVQFSKCKNYKKSNQDYESCQYIVFSFFVFCSVFFVFCIGIFRILYLYISHFVFVVLAMCTVPRVDRGECPLAAGVVR